SYLLKIFQIKVISVLKIMFMTGRVVRKTALPGIGGQGDRRGLADAAGAAPAVVSRFPRCVAGPPASCRRGSRAPPRSPDKKNRSWNAQARWRRRSGGTRRWCLEGEAQRGHVAAAGAVQAAHQLFGVGHARDLGVGAVLAVQQ